MKYLILFALFVIPASIFLLEGNRMVVFAEEDPLEDEAEVEGEAEVEEVAGTEEEDDEVKTTSSPDADTTILFVKPTSQGAGQLEIPVGIPVEFLVGFRNKGKEDFILETLEASFRYPMDFNFYIQNFSAIVYNKVVPPSQEATLAYSFIASEAFAGRPFGLNVNLNYRDASGANFQEAVYNETVQIIELDEGLDGETFFLYVFLAAGVILLLVIGQQTLLSVGRKRTSRRTPVETGTSNPNNVDLGWIPKQTLYAYNKQNKSPASKKQSPRQRKRNTGSE